MGEESELLVTWQDYYRKLLNAEDEKYESGASGTEYTEDELMRRMRKEIEMMDEGVYPANNGKSTRPVPRIENEEEDYFLREAIDREWYDLIAGDRYQDDIGRWIPGETSNNETFVQYSPEERSSSPHQGWKVRVASYADEAREVGNAVLPYLKENDISHKVMQDSFAFNNTEGTRQEGKFITIYPDIDEDRQVIMEDGAQIFKRDDPNWNIFSINSNTKNARKIIKDLEEELRGSAPGLEGRSINGKNGEEKQYRDTRIHFRYAHHFNTPAEILDQQGRIVEEVEDHQGLVNKGGELIEGSYIGDQIGSATRPDALL